MAGCLPRWLKSIRRRRKQNSSTTGVVGNDGRDAPQGHRGGAAEPSKEKEEPSPSDRAVLVEFFYATNGHAWRKDTGWCTLADIGSWFGVTADNEGRVIELELRANNLSGTLPPVLAHLHHLRVLNLEFNQIGGPIPEELGNLPNLKLHLWSNPFIVSNVKELGERSKVYEETANKNRRFQGLDKTYGLEDLYLGVLDDSSDGDSFVTTRWTPSTTSVDRAALLALFEATNGFNWRNNRGWQTDTNIGSWFGVHVNEQGNVVRLDLRANNLTGELPADLGNLGHLKLLNLGTNRLRVLPKETAARLLKLESLRKITLQKNPWEEPPPAVVEAGLGAIIRYYEAIERSGASESWRIKVVLVGAVCAGKSSVVASLMAREPQLVPLANRTRGVDVHVEQPFKPGGSKASLVFWDFAGHDDYHSTHSLFLSEGALFLLVVDLARFVVDPSSRSDAIYVWLDTLLCRAPGAVVQIIATHIDELVGGHDVDVIVREVRQSVSAHLKAKRQEYERGWKSGVGKGEMPAAPTLRIIYQIHSVSCKTGDHWPELGRTIANLAALGTAESLLEPSVTSAQSAQRKDKLFPTLGLKVPTIWARAAAVMDALREGTDPGLAAQLLSSPPLVNKARNRYLGWEEAVRIWENIVETSEFLGEIGSVGATSVLQDAIRLKENEGMCLLENGLLHLDPTWINELLRAILDHRLQDPTERGFWEGELQTFADLHPRLDFAKLANAHGSFCATGTLTVGYLRFLWRKVKDIDHEELFDRLLETMRKHGVVFGGLDDSSMDGSTADGDGGCAALFVPVRLQAYIGEERLKEFSGPCFHNEWRLQQVFRVWQSYVPPGIIGMLLARLLDLEEVHLHCAWSRGLSFMMGGSEVLLYLNPPTVGTAEIERSPSEMKKAEIQINVVGPKRSDEVELKVRKVGDELRAVLTVNFPGLRFHHEEVRSVEGADALMERIDALQAHLDVRLDEIEGKLDEVAASSRKSLMCLDSLQAPNFPYPHLAVVREHTPSSGDAAGRRRKKRVLSKALFKSFCARARTAAKKEMRLQFLCPYDFSEVPCGPDGQGYRFGKTRDWVKKIFPAVQVTAMIAKVALKAASGLDLDVSDFLNALKEGVGEEIADRALDEDTLRRVVMGEEDASPGMKGTSRASYEAIKRFMDKERKKPEYVDFDQEMQHVDDGKAGMVWVSNGNVQRWLTSRSIAPSA